MSVAGLERMTSGSVAKRALSNRATQVELQSQCSQRYAISQILFMNARELLEDTVIDFRIVIF